MLAMLSIFSNPSVLYTILADTISDDAVLDVTAVVGGPIVPGSGGSSGSGSNTSQGTVTLSGFVFPNAKITLLKDGQIVTTLVANSDGTFKIIVNGLNLGSYQFAIISEDRDGASSAPAIVNATISQPIGYTFAGIVIPPTIRTNTTTVGTGQTLVVFGYAPANSTVNIDILNLYNAGTTTADSSGFYRFEVLNNLTPNTYYFRSRAQIGEFSSMYSKPVAVTYYRGVVPPGTPPGSPPTTPPTQLEACVDYNKDSRVNLVDFSILLYWFNKPNPPRHIDCNADNRVDIKDFSILMYFWTG